jgi:hypothetical protein
MSSSSIPTFIDTLKTTLEARAALAGVAITDGIASPGDMNAEELIQILDATGEQSVRALDRTTQPRNEEYAVTVLVSVVAQTREDQTTLKARAFELLAEVEATLRADPHLGISNLYSAVGGHIHYASRATDLQREAAIEFDINVHARL